MEEQQSSHVLVDAVEETCVLVGIITQAITEDQAKEYIEELRFLAETAGAITQKVFLQKVQIENPKTFVGKGKIEEVRDYVQQNAIDIVIFDDELSPSQLRNIKEF